MNLHIQNIRTKLASDSEIRYKFIEQHKEIYNAIKEKNSNRAIRALKVHLNYFDELINKKQND